MIAFICQRTARQCSFFLSYFSPSQTYPDSNGRRVKALASYCYQKIRPGIPDGVSGSGRRAGTPRRHGRDSHGVSGRKEGWKAEPHGLKRQLKIKYPRTRGRETRRKFSFACSAALELLWKGKAAPRLFGQKVLSGKITPLRTGQRNIFLVSM